MLPIFEMPLISRLAPPVGHDGFSAVGAGGGCTGRLLSHAGVHGELLQPVPHPRAVSRSKLVSEPALPTLLGKPQPRQAQP